MSKNLTRKGLALGAVVALGSSLFAGAPAFAADELSLQPSAGTTYNTLASESFTLTAAKTVGYQSADLAYLRYAITNASGATLAFADQAATITPASAATATTNVLDPALATAGNANTLKITTTTTTADVAVGVQAWLDLNTNSTIDSGEWVSPVRTINFIQAANLTTTTVLTQPVLGDLRLNATVAFSGTTGAINASQVAIANLKVQFTKAAASITSNTVLTANALAGEAVVLDATNNNFKVQVSGTDGAATDSNGNTATGTNEPVANAVYAAQAIYSATPGTANTWAAVGSASSRTVVAAVVTGIAAPVVTAGANVAGTGANIIVREAFTGATTVKVAVTKADGTDAGTDPDSVGAGTKVTVKVTEPNTTATRSTTVYTVGGKTLADTTTATDSVTFEGTTDADGNVVFTLASSTGKATEAVTIFAYGDGVNLNGANSSTFTWTAVSAKSLIDNAAIGTGAVRSVVKGGTVSINYTIVDNFGQPLPGTAYRVKAVDATVTGGADFEKYANASNGVASLSFADNSTAATGNYDVAASIQKLNATTQNYDDVSITDLDPYTAGNQATLLSQVKVVSSVEVASADFDSTTKTAATTSATTAVALSTTALTATDKRTVTTTTAHGLGTDGMALSGTAIDAAGNGRAGAAVVISGSGVAFSYGTDYSTLNSITVLTDGTGVFTGVRVFSNTSGKKTITVTAGGVSKTVDVVFAAAGTDSGATLAFTSKNIVQSGRTLVITGTLTDKYGNPVAATAGDFSAVYSGPGYEFTSAVTSTTATGTFTIRVLIGTGEVGVASVTATYNKGTVATGAAADTITKSQTILIGVSASVSAGKKLATSVVKNAAGATIKVVSGSKSVTKVATSDSYKVSLTKLTAGKKTVKVYVNDILVSSKSVTVKK